MAGEHQDSPHPFAFRIAAPLLLLASVAVLSSGCGAEGLQASLHPAASQQESAGAVQCSTRQSGPDAPVIKGVPVRQTAVGNDPDFGFASTKYGLTYRNYALPSVGNPVKLAVVPIILYAGEDNRLVGQRVVDKMPSVAVLQEAFFSDDLSGLASEELKKAAFAFSPLGSLTHYFSECSNKKMHLEGRVFDFSTIPSCSDHKGWYVHDEDMEGSSAHPEQQIGWHAINKILGSSVHRSQLEDLDNLDQWDSSQGRDGISFGIPDPESDQDLYFDCVLFLLARMQPSNSYNGYFQSNPEPPVDPGLTSSIDGKPVRSFIMVYVMPTTAGSGPVTGLSFSMWWVAHEIGHAMGLPDLYDAYDQLVSPMAKWTGDPAANPLEHNPYSPEVSDPSVSDADYGDYLVLNERDYGSINRCLPHYAGHEKYLLGWIDSIVEVDYTDPSSMCELKPITDGEMLVVHAVSPSAIHSDWPLFKGSGPTAPTDQYLVFENRGSDVTAKFDYSPSGCGLYGYWVDTTRAGEGWQYVMECQHYNNVYRQICFDSMTGTPQAGGSVVKGGNQASYMSPYTGLRGPLGAMQVVTSALGDLLPSIVCVNNPLLTADNVARVQVYPEHSPQVHLVEARHRPLFSQEHGGDAYELSVLFWDSEFSHSWPGGEDDPPYSPSFRVTYDKLLSWDGDVDPSFDPIVRTNLYEQFKAIVSVQVLLNGGLPGEHYFRATIENLNPRTTTRTAEQRTAALPFSIPLEDPITIPGEEPVTLSFAEARIQALFIPVGTGPEGGVWNYIEDSTQDPTFDVAYCGRTGGDDEPLGYEPGLDVSLEGSVKFKFVGSGTKTVAVTMRHQIEKAIPADNDTGGNANWDLIGRPWDDSDYQVDGDRLYVELRRFTDGANEYKWFPAPYVGLEPGGEETTYQTYNLELTDLFLSGPGLDVLNADDSGTKYAQLRLRFVADDSVQFEGVSVKELVLNQ